MASSLRSQQEWDEHALFMDGLAADGVLVLGGPLEGTPDFLLAVKAADEAEVRSILDSDPWSKLGLLDVKSIQVWTILLESGEVD